MNSEEIRRGEETILELPAQLQHESEDSSEDELFTAPTSQDFRFNDQIFHFPGNRNANQSIILEECFPNLTAGKNVLLECPVDEDRRVASITALLHHLSFAEEQHRIYYVTKTFAEIEDILDQLKKFKYTGYLGSVKLAVLGKPSQLCSFCNRNDIYLCNNPKPAVDAYNFVEADGLVRNLAHFRKKASSRKFCAYRHATETLMSTANFVICLQQQFLSSVFRENHELPLEKSVIIFDDAGHIENACYAAVSASITTRGLEKAVECFRSLANFFEGRNQRSEATSLTKLSRSLSSFATTVNEQTWQQEEEKFRANSDRLLDILKITGLMGSQIREYADVLRNVLQLLSHNPEDIRSAMIEAMAGTSVQIITSIQNLLASLNYMHANIKNEFLMHVSTYVPLGAEPANTFKIRFVNLAAILEPIVSQTTSVILSSNCLPPLSILRHEVDDAPFQFHEDVVALESATPCFLGYCSEGPNQVSFKLDHKNQGRVSVQEETGQAILEIARKLPGGIIVFFPSVPKLQDYIKCWKSRGSSIMDDLMEVKEVWNELDVRNEEDAIQKIIKFRRLCKGSKGKTGAILLALHREKISQVMKFEPGEVYGVISLGIPYHSTKAFEILAKEQYIKHRDIDEWKKSNNLWYNAEAFHNQNYKFSHFVRKSQPWFVSLIFDERMEFKVNNGDAQRLLPQWMLNGRYQWREHRDFQSDLMAGLDDFIKANE